MLYIHKYDGHYNALRPLMVTGKASTCVNATEMLVDGLLKGEENI